MEMLEVESRKLAVVLVTSLMKVDPQGLQVMRAFSHCVIRAALGRNAIMEAGPLRRRQSSMGFRCSRLGKGERKQSCYSGARKGQRASKFKPAFAMSSLSRKEDA